MQEKIIQIINSPTGLTAYFHDNSIPLDAEGRGSATGIPVCCLALVEVTDATGTYREVRPMIMYSEGYANFVTERSDFVCTDHDEPQHFCDCTK